MKQVFRPILFLAAHNKCNQSPLLEETPIVESGVEYWKRRPVHFPLWPCDHMFGSSVQYRYDGGFSKRDCSHFYRRILHFPEAVFPGMPLHLSRSGSNTVRYENQDW